MIIKINLSRQNRLFVGNHTDFGLSFNTAKEQDYCGQMVPRKPTYVLYFKGEKVNLTQKQANNLMSFLGKIEE